MNDKKPGPSKPGFAVRQDGRKPLFAARQTQPQEPKTALSRSKSSPSAHDKPSTNAGNTGNPGNPNPGKAGSASPATPGSRIPRFGTGFGSRKPMSLAEAFKIASEEQPAPIDGSPSPAPRSWRRPDAREPDSSPNKERIAMRNRVDDGIGKSRTSRWVLEEGLRDDAPLEGGMRDAPLEEGMHDAPLPSTENAGESPEKSYAWQVDEDFTAGDLQVSDSPRIRVNQPPFAKARSESPLKATPKLEEIRARELGLTPNVGKTTKLDEIRSREKQVEALPLLERGFPRIGSGHIKLDDIKQRETQGLSRRAIAQAKLEDIKERNAMTRSVSPDSPRRPHARQTIPRSKSAFEPAGRQVPDTPVTIYKSEAGRVADGVRRAAAKKADEKAETLANRANGLSPQKRDQSRDLLRKLARAASASPAGRDEPRITVKVEPRASSLKPSALVDRRGRASNASIESKSVSSSDRPTVGFAGLARSRSSDSRKSKRSSMHSEQDPTDRIEAEERLFAPLDNYSERGSVRAPSPDHDATPRQTRPDVMSMPTPRAPGAFVDTPVTVKADRPRLSLEESPDVKPATGDGKAAWRKDVDTASDPGATEEKTNRPVRSRSLPRRRPLTNSAKLPSVRDDLRELQRIHNIDDTTLDNLEDILLGKKTTNEKLDELLREIPAVAEVVEEMQDEAVSGMERVDKDLDDELAAYEALSASVERDLGVHKGGDTNAEAARKNTQTTLTHAKNDKLADKMHPKTEIRIKTEPSAMDEKHQHTHDAQCPLCVAPPPHVAYLHLPLPRLFHRAPRLRLTLLGALLTLLTLWSAAETAMCRLYCRPTTCAEPCVWSFDDPVAFGTALPIKLDQWTTGGRGRAAWQEVGDWAAGVRDAVGWGADVEAMTTAQRRRYRRRVAKRKGLSEEQRSMVEAWRREREMEERMRQRGMEASVGGDERVWE